MLAWIFFGVHLFSIACAYVFNNEVTELWDTRPEIRRIDGPASEHQNYVITASKIIRPGTTYSVVASFTLGSEETLVKCYVSKDGVNLAIASGIAEGGQPVSLQMQIPVESTPGSYSLKVEGYTGAEKNALSFSATSPLQFSPEFLTILTETSRAAYMNSMTVLFRVVMLQIGLKPHGDPVDITILNPDGYIMRRWPSRYSTAGVISLSYKLPSLPKEGTWTIRVQAGMQVHNSTFIVEQYFIPQFEFTIESPPYIFASDESLSGTITSQFHPAKIKFGDITVRCLAKRTSDIAFKEFYNKTERWNHKFKFSIPLKQVPISPGGSTLGTILRIEATVYNGYLGEARTSFAETKIVDPAVRITFLGPRNPFFKPGSRFSGYLAVSHEHSFKMAKSLLELGTLRVKAYATLDKGVKQYLGEIYIPSANSKGGRDSTASGVDLKKYRTEGLMHFGFDVPFDAEEVRVIATYVHPKNGKMSSNELIVNRASYPDNQIISLSSSSEEADIGEFAVFHLKANFPLEFFSYLVISKGLVLYSNTAYSEFTSQRNVITFTVPISAEMAPTFTVLAYVLNGNFLVADSVTVPVKSISRYEVRQFRAINYVSHSQNPFYQQAKNPDGT